MLPTLPSSTFDGRGVSHFNGGRVAVSRLRYVWGRPSRHPPSMTPHPVPFRPRPFRPSPWARDPHLQTLMARGLRSADGPVMTRERWEVPDGDFLDVDLGPDPGPQAPLALVLHGLEGSSRRRYVLSVCRELLARGVRPVAMNFRGCSGEIMRIG